MNKLKCSLAAKVFAWLLSLIMLFTAAACVVASNYMISNNFYDRTEKEAQLRAARSAAYDISYRLFSYYENYQSTNSPNFISFDELISSMNDAKNFRYTLKDSEGNIISGNYDGEEAIGFDFKNDLYEEDFWYDTEEPQYETLTTTIYVLNKKTETDRFSIAEKAVSFLYKVRFSVYFVLAAAVMLFFALAAFLIASAGHKSPDGEIRKGLCEKTPCDVFTLYIILAAVANILALIACYDVAGVMLYVVIPVLLLLDYLLVSLWIKNIAINVKLGTVTNSLFILKLLKPVFNSVKTSKGLLRTILLSSLPCLVLLFLLYLFMGGYMMADVFILWSLCSAVYMGLAVYRTIKLGKLLKVTSKIASGDLTESVDINTLYGEMRELGKNINQINDGLQIALDDKMKSERFKTELITNVSHDLKTPLTSIINYIDLLDKLDLEDEKAAEYIGVLSRQSARLKKLTEDLLEASKASTGNIKIELSKCDVKTLISQTVGEFSERLENAQLSLIVNTDEQPLEIMADGKRLYRVFENLMSNICKYSLASTRVYITAEKKEDKIEISFKNISRDMPDISSDELTKRFVRGDSSRNTEGSGLGLSIAKSLTELQGGKFFVKVDGDLFSAGVVFVCI